LITIRLPSSRTSTSSLRSICIACITDAGIRTAALVAPLSDRRFHHFSPLYRPCIYIMISVPPLFALSTKLAIA
jgi:hypothetical protein